MAQDLYIANPTPQSLLFTLSRRGKGNFGNVMIRPFSMARVLNNQSNEVIEDVVMAHAPYGLVSDQSFQPQRHYVPMFYRVGDPIPRDMILEVFANNNAFKQSDAREKSMMGAAAAQAIVKENGGDPETLEILVEEKVEDHSKPQFVDGITAADPTAMRLKRRGKRI